MLHIVKANPAVKDEHYHMIQHKDLSTTLGKKTCFVQELHWLKMS